MRPERSSPEARERANMRLRRLTRSAVISGHRCHRADRRRRGKGASWREFGGQYQRDDAGPSLRTTSTSTSPSTAAPTTTTASHVDTDDSCHLGEQSTPATVPTTLAPTTTTTGHPPPRPPHDHHDSSRGHLGRHIAVTATMASSLGPWLSGPFEAIGTTATVVVVDASRLDAAESLLRDEIEAIDLACSRFRPDSELGEPSLASRLIRRGLPIALRGSSSGRRRRGEDPWGR